jgi:hypothetical protein
VTDLKSNRPTNHNGAPAITTNGSHKRGPASQALRLGWLTAEIYGLVRRGALDHRDAIVRQQPPHNPPRLTISDRNWKNSRSRLLLTDLRALKQLALKIDLWPDPDFHAVDEHVFPALVDHLLLLLEQTGRSPLPGRFAFFRQLEVWSLYAHSKLLTRGDMNAKAFSYGASIADTYWYMALPPRRGEDERHKREKWAKLLSPYRMREESARIVELADFLDAHVAASLQYSLERWGIANILQQQGDAFTPNKEKKLIKALEKQAYIWRDLILGLNRPIDYLPPASKRWAWLWHKLIFILSIISFFVIFAVVLYGLIQLLFLLLPFLQQIVNFFVDPDDLRLGDLITVLSITVAILATVWAAVRGATARFFQFYDWLRQSILQYFIVRHTWWKPWPDFNWWKEKLVNWWKEKST